MAKLILSSGTEDFVTPESDDALLMLATELHKHGREGCFALVGDKLRAPPRRGCRAGRSRCARRASASQTPGSRPAMWYWPRGLPWLSTPYSRLSYVVGQRRRFAGSAA